MIQAVFGSSGMVGRAIYNSLGGNTYEISRAWGDLRKPEVLYKIFCCLPRLDVLYLCAARVGGIGKNMAHPGEMFYDNIAIQTNVIEAARRHLAKLIVFMGSSCIYPKNALQPIRESALGTGLQEPTNEAYAAAKLAGIKMLEAYHVQYGLEYLVPMPCNLFGQHDSFELDTCHMIPALIRRFYEARQTNAPSVTLWGTGTPRRELLHVTDLADAVSILVSKNVRGVVNVGRGYDLTIAQIAELVKDASGYTGNINFDGNTEKDGNQSKLMAVNPALKDWHPEALESSISKAVRWYHNGQQTIRRTESAA